MNNLLLALVVFYSVFSGFVFVCFLLFYADPVQRLWETKRRVAWAFKLFALSVFWLPAILLALVLVAFGIIRKEAL